MIGHTPRFDKSRKYIDISVGEISHKIVHLKDVGDIVNMEDQLPYDRIKKLISLLALLNLRMQSLFIHYCISE
jgi:hypothetical protein